MEQAYYDSANKEMYVLLGYGIGSHLSLQYLQQICNDIQKKFPKLTDSEKIRMKFLEVNRGSSRHRYCWYTSFPYEIDSIHFSLDNSTEIKEAGISVYCPAEHVKGVNGWLYESETIQQIIHRLIHD